MKDDTARAPADALSVHIVKSSGGSKEQPASSDVESAAEALTDTVAKIATEAGPREVGGPKGLEPTRYGDWERKGRCVDF